MSNSTKRILLLLGITVAAAGGYVGYKFYKKKKEEENNKETVEKTDSVSSEEKKEEQPEKFIFGDSIATMPEKVEVNHEAYNKVMTEYKGEESEEPEEEPELEEKIMASKAYDDYLKKNANKIIVLPEEQISYTWNQDIGNDPENPDVMYEEEELYYFTEDERLTDEDGNDIDEEQYLGKKPRQFGWFSNDEEDLYVRNNPLERDFRVNKVNATKEDYFPSYQ